MANIRVLLRTTVPFAEDDRQCGRFSLLSQHLASTRDIPVEVTARNLERGARP